MALSDFFQRQQPVEEPKAEPDEFDEVMAELESFAKAYSKAKPKKKVKVEHGEVDYDKNENDVSNDVAEGSGYHDEEEDVDDENPDESGPPYRPEYDMQKMRHMKKSIEIDGREIEAMDPDVFMKSLEEKIESVVRRATNAQTMAKALHALGSRLRAIEDELNAIGGRPRMRKSVVSIHERNMNGQPVGQPKAGVSAQELLAKATAPGGAVSRGLVTPTEISKLQYYANRGMMAPSEISDKIANL